MEKIIVVDFGGQYTQLIAKRVREAHVFSEIVSNDISPESLLQHKPKGIILSGGPDSVYEKDAPSLDKKILELGIPVLGICYGMQLLSHLLGGKVTGGTVKEYGETTVSIHGDRLLLTGVPGKINAWMSHGDSVTVLPEGFVLLAKTDHHVAAIADEKRRIYGVQFHPEVTHTEHGKEMIANFVMKVCACSGSWSMENFIEESKSYIQETVGKNDVISFVSGGVDSSFVTALLAKTPGIGNVHAIYIEGLMRKDETMEVKNSLEKAGVRDLIIYKGEDEFIKELEGVVEPEEKRKRIGNLFGRIQGKMIDKLALDPQRTFLAQGTLYTDLIESGKGCGNKAAKIKSHHNVGCEFIDELKRKGRIVEPNRLIFKDEVRLAAKSIGLAPEIYQRQPFPGPGLGIRIVDGNPAWVDEAFKDASRKVAGIAAGFGLEGFIIPVKTVGVQGDGRTYRFVCVLRGREDWKKIREAAVRIPMDVNLVNRVVYEVQPGSPMASTSVVPTNVTKETIRLLQDIDLDGRMLIEGYDFPSPITQTIFILLGSDVHGTCKRSVALRAVATEDFMTVRPVEPVDARRYELKNYPEAKLSWECLHELKEMITSRYPIGAFFIDVTDKPPATTCWE